MVNTWYITLEKNSTTSPCGGTGCTLVYVELNGVTIKQGGYGNTYTDAQIITAQIAVLKTSGFGTTPITYLTDSDTIYVDNVLYYQSITHHLDIHVTPYSWHTQNGAADYLITKLSDINGTLLNLFSGITDYQYISTEIIPNQNSNIIIRINLKQLSVLSMVTPTLIIQISAIIIGLAIIISFIGWITGYDLTTALFEQVFGKKLDSQDIVTKVFGPEGVVEKQVANCKTSSNGNATTYSTCVKDIAKTNIDGSKDIIGTSNTDTIINNTNTKIDGCLSQYNIDSDLSKYYLCIDGVIDILYTDIKKETPVSTSILNKTTLMIVGGLFAAYLLMKD